MQRSRRFLAVDILYLSIAVLPLLFGIILKILTTPASEGITITGAQVYFTVPMPLQSLPVSAAQVNSVLVIISVLGLCLYLTHGIAVRPNTKRQHIAEWIVEKTEGLVSESMGGYFSGYAPFIGTIVPLPYYGKEKKVRSVMIEINRKLYMDRTGRKISAFGKVRTDIRQFLDQLSREEDKHLADE